MEMGEGSYQVSIDVDELTKTVSTELERLRPFLNTYCIRRAPKLLLLLKKEAYIPRFISIGPYHHGREELKPMEEHKKRYLKHFLQRTNISSVELLEVVAKNEEKLRNCYAEIIDHTSHEFVKMILFDAVFIIEFLLRLNDEVEDFLLNNSSLGAEISNDLFFLENQIPFFILEDIFKLREITEKELCFRKVALVFSDYNRYYFDSSEEEIGSSQEIKHLLDFVRICSKPSKAERRKIGMLETPTMPTATELRQAGVMFRARASEKSLFDIKFSNGILEIPPIAIDGYTEILLRNMIASEQCPDVVDNFFNDYVHFMNLLANSPEDVKLLVEKGILRNFKYDNERISNLIRGLAEASIIWPNRFYYATLVEDLKAYCKVPRHKWKATLKQDYFSNPWAIISVIAAVFLLILTVIQAVCSILQFHHSG